MANQDGNDVVIQITEMLEKPQPIVAAECCIYRVPHDIRKLNEEAYTPKVVSIGPLHRGDNGRLADMEGPKISYFKKFLERSLASLEELASCVQILEPKVRRSYSDNIKLSKEEFVKVILVDCGFICEFFLRCHFGQWSETDVILSKPKLANDIMYDLLLLENQLPFFVLEELYNLAFPSRSRADDETETLYPFFLDLCVEMHRDNLPHSAGTEEVAHFTDLLRTCNLQPPEKRLSREPGQLTHVGSATELNEAGVKFMASDEPSNKCLLDWKFSGRTLKIPQIKVVDSTETLLRNMVALEQCHYPFESYIVDYLMFLDFLINTDKDVDILVKHEIIVNWLGDSHAVAKMFNGLCKNVALARYNAEYLRIANELNTFCKHPVHRRVATLRRDYCNTPWKTAASIAAIVLLILTVVQTVCSILQVK